MTLTVFGYLIFYFPIFSLSFLFLRFLFEFRLTRCIKHSRERLTTFPNTAMIVKNTPLRVVFSIILLSVFRNVVKHGLTCFIDYFANLTCLSKLRCRAVSLPWQAAKQQKWKRRVFVQKKRV